MFKYIPGYIVEYITYTLYKIVALTVLIVAYIHSAYNFKWHSKKSSGVHNKKQRENVKICRENEKCLFLICVMYREVIYLYISCKTILFGNHFLVQLTCFVQRSLSTTI